MNKREIEKAFEICPNSIIIYVFGTQNGRIRNEDIIALNDAYSFKDKSLIFVINGISRQNRSSNYQGETITYLKSIFGKSMSNSLCFLDYIDPNNSIERDQLREILMKDSCRLIPNIHEKQHEIQLQTDQINALKKALQKQKIQFDQQQEQMKDQFIKAQQLYEQDFKYNQIKQELKRSQEEQRLHQSQIKAQQKQLQDKLFDQQQIADRQ